MYLNWYLGAWPSALAAFTRLGEGSPACNAGVRRSMVSSGSVREVRGSEMQTDATSRDFSSVFDSVGKALFGVTLQCCRLRRWVVEDRK